MRLVSILTFKLASASLYQKNRRAKIATSQQNKCQWQDDFNPKILFFMLELLHLSSWPLSFEGPLSFLALWKNTLTHPKPSSLSTSTVHLQTGQCGNQVGEFWIHSSIPSQFPFCLSLCWQSLFKSCNLSISLIPSYSQVPSSGKFSLRNMVLMPLEPITETLIFNSNVSTFTSEFLEVITSSSPSRSISPPVFSRTHPHPPCARLLSSPQPNLPFIATKPPMLSTFLVPF